MAVETHNSRRNSLHLSNGYEQDDVEIVSILNIRSKKLKSKAQKASSSNLKESISRKKGNKLSQKKVNKLSNKKISRQKNTTVSPDNEPTHSQSISQDSLANANSDLQVEMDCDKKGIDSPKTDFQSIEMDVGQNSSFQRFNQELSCICINNTTKTFQNNSINASISLDSKGMFLLLPRYKKSSKTVPVLLSESNVENVMVYCDSCSYSYISIITSPTLGETLKENLKIYNSSSPYFDPDADSVKQLKISFLLQNVTDDIITYLYSIYDESKITNINEEEALEMLHSTSSDNDSSFPQMLVSDILVYPPVGGVEIKSKDIACLVNGKSLNDTIIEFYLKYIYYEKISPDMRKRTHIFNPFFYSGLERIFGSHITLKTGLENIDSVKQWTKNVDIFSKDFIFLPINKKKHWYLVVICYLTEMLKKCEEITLDIDSAETKRKESSKLPKPCQSDDRRKTRKQNEFAKSERKPCIMFFDSLDGSSRMNHEKLKVASTLEKYFELLWKSKNPDVPSDWKKLLFLKASCPQQKNTFDCGIYLLQYVESFLEKPISFSGETLPNLKNWFRDETMKRKRSEIKSVITELKGQQSETFISLTTHDDSFDIIDIT